MINFISFIIFTLGFTGILWMPRLADALDEDPLLALFIALMCIFIGGLGLSLP